MTARRSATAVALAMVVVLSAACSGGTTVRSAEKTNGRARLPREFASAVQGLCVARRDARSSPAASKASFVDGAHEPLHEIARRLGDVDRTAAASVLRAKQRVEADLSTSATSAELAADLDRLVVATGEGLERLGFDAPGCDS